MQPSINKEVDNTDDVEWRIGYVRVGEEYAVRAFVQSDYDLGKRIIVGQTTVGEDGRWARPLWLCGGVTYVLTYLPMSGGHTAVATIAVPGAFDGAAT